jgi:chloramphenicol-sensitive protein RarD
VSDSRRGFLLGVAAYVLWGMFPLYWPLLEPAGAIEILAHRIVWSVVVMVVLVLAVRRVTALRMVLQDSRRRALLVAAALVITVNWGTYIWGVNNHHVVETSLGYFINPLVTVLMGVLVLRERLRGLQWVAMGIGTLAVLVLAFDYGRPPWVALTLALSFGTYGLLKKTAGVGAIESLTLETTVLAPFALGYLVWLGATGSGHFTGHGSGHTLLLAGSGVVTAVPLICFGAAATSIPMTTLGLLQYLAPVLQFGVGVLVRHEDMTAASWAGFGLVWVALAVFTAESISQRRRQQLALSTGAAAV